MQKLQKSAMALAKKIKRVANLMEQESERIRMKETCSQTQLKRAEDLNYKADYIHASASEIEDAAIQLTYRKI